MSQTGPGVASSELGGAERDGGSNAEASEPSPPSQPGSSLQLSGSVCLACPACERRQDKGHMCGSKLLSMVVVRTDRQMLVKIIRVYKGTAYAQQEKLLYT